MTCSICFENAATFKTECNHSFCNQCATHWLLTNNTCPCCRSNIIKKETPKRKKVFNIEFVRESTFTFENVPEKFLNRVDDLINALFLRQPFYYDWGKDDDGTFITKIKKNNRYYTIKINIYNSNTETENFIVIDVDYKDTKRYPKQNDLKNKSEKWRMKRTNFKPYNYRLVK